MFYIAAADLMCGVKKGSSINRTRNEGRRAEAAVRITYSLLQQRTKLFHQPFDAVCKRLCISKCIVHVLLYYPVVCFVYSHPKKLLTKSRIYFRALLDIQRFSLRFSSFLSHVFFCSTVPSIAFYHHQNQSGIQPKNRKNQHREYIYFG